MSHEDFLCRKKSKKTARLPEASDSLASATKKCGKNSTVAVAQ
jgi:hypothetical protein